MGMGFAETNQFPLLPGRDRIWVSVRWALCSRAISTHPTPTSPAGIGLEDSHMRRFIVVCSVFALLVTGFWAFGKEKESAKAAATRKKLQEKISVDYQDEPIRNVVDDLKSKVKGLGSKIVWVGGGVCGNITLSCKAEDKTLAEILDTLFKGKDLGYVVVSKEGNAYDGALLIKKGKERGYPAGEEPDKATAKGKD